ncbi:MAG: hypothetical protein NZ841_03550 [Dictyoglomus sp.]|nr:hypothetical protein [Dictyoglomus sp.]MCX7942840.1 hypothetical protein [Dictyoglomaceae bacterium]MDW8188352.1 hypothetical protein [Dictyoglomus sp.]
MKNENKENYFENFLEKLEEIRLKRTLRLRGYTITESCSLNRVILPKKQDIKIWETYYQLLSHYRFRRLISDLIQVKTSGFIDLSLLLTKWTWEEISNYFKFLEEAGILERIGDKFYFLYDLIDNFGETLEWFVAQILKREFSIPAFWGVKLLGISGGGDFDVLGLVENYLLYIECKTSPPNNIRLRDLWEFLRRREVLGSQLTIFLIDTTLKVERNIVDNVKLLLDRRFSPYKKNEVIKEKEGVYFFSPNLFILQSKGDFIVNFQHVFRKFLEKVFNY